MTPERSRQIEEVFLAAADAPRLFADRFEVERVAGSGGMGTVYRARDRSTGATVALKLTHHGGVAPEAAARFEREARLLAEIEHHGIVAYVAHGETADGRLYLAMEWLDGEDLAARLSRGPLSPDECVALLRRVASALAVAHRRGVVHRDLKPSNLFLVAGAVADAKVLDFGIARRTVASQVMTQTGTLLGTPDYMAPEQVRGAREIAPAADVFALGCVAYECLAGQRPFGAEHPMAVLARILFDDPAPVDQVRPGVSAPLAALLRRMLAKDPTQRPADAGTLGAELIALDEIPKPAARPQLLSAFAQRQQGLLSLVVAALPPPSGDGETVAEEEPGAEAARRSEVRSALSVMGLSADFMADGSLVVKVQGAGSATDQAVLAARAALVVKERWPTAVVALATGRGAVEGAFTVGEVADRTVRLLTAVETRSGVRVDVLSARLLEARFLLTPSPEGAILIGQERDADARRPLLGKPTSCVGREAELGSLEALFAGCVQESEARAVLVTAPPGAGKSRLRHELLRRIERRSEPVVILAGRGDAMRAGAPYGTLASAIRSLAVVNGDVAPEEQRRRIRDRVGRHVVEADRERVVRFLGELCDVPFPDEGLPMLTAARHEPKIMGDCLRRAVLDFLAAECGAGPALVVLDDLQWGDALTVSVLDNALREQAGAPLFLIALARPEVHEAFPRLWRAHKPQEVALRGLSPKACERLIREVLGQDVPAALVDRAIDQSGGNALFLEEMIRAIAEGKGEEQPETVVAMLQARMGRLPVGPRRALQAASVFGQAFWEGGVAWVLGVPPGTSAEVGGWLSALVDAELIQPSATTCLPGEKEHAFRHALVRDAAYGLLTPGDVATGHRLAGEFLETAGEHDAAIVAEHFERGEVRERAAMFYLRAAEDCLPRGDYAGARRLCDRGLGCVPEGEVLGALKSVACTAALSLAAYEGMRDAARTAMALLRPGSLGWSRALLAAVHAEISKPARVQELLSVLDGTDPDPGVDACVAYIETQVYVSGILPLAAPEPMVRRHLDRLELTVDSLRSTIPAVRRYFLGARGFATVWRYPRPWSAMLDNAEALRLAREVADERLELTLRVNAAEMSWLELGDLEGARRRMLVMEDKLSESQERWRFAQWVAYLVRILCEVPDEQAWERADALVARVLASTSGTPLISHIAQRSRARIALVRGQLEEAEKLSREAAASIPTSLTGWIPPAVAHIRALTRLGRAAEACALADQANGAIRMLGGAGCFEVETRLAVTEAFEANGDHNRARAELAETLRQVQIRRDDIADPFWRNSYLTRNPHVARTLALGEAWGLPPLPPPRA